jgi:hypothetical protein
MPAGRIDDVATARAGLDSLVAALSNADLDELARLHSHDCLRDGRNTFGCTGRFADRDHTNAQLAQLLRALAMERQIGRHQHP